VKIPSCAEIGSLCLEGSVDAGVKPLERSSVEVEARSAERARSNGLRPASTEGQRRGDAETRRRGAVVEDGRWETGDSRERTSRKWLLPAEFEQKLTKGTKWADLAERWRQEYGEGFAIHFFASIFLPFQPDEHGFDGKAEIKKAESRKQRTGIAEFEQKITKVTKGRENLICGQLHPPNTSTLQHSNTPFLSLSSFSSLPSVQNPHCGRAAVRGETGMDWPNDTILAGVSGLPSRRLLGAVSPLTPVLGLLWKHEIHQIHEKGGDGFEQDETERTETGGINHKEHREHREGTGETVSRKDSGLCVLCVLCGSISYALPLRQARSAASQPIS